MNIEEGMAEIEGIERERYENESDTIKCNLNASLSEFGTVLDFIQRECRQQQTIVHLIEHGSYRANTFNRINIEMANVECQVVFVVR